MNHLSNKIMKYHRKNNSDLIISMNRNNKRGFNNIGPSSLIYTSYVTVLNLHFNSKNKNTKLSNKNNTKSFDNRNKKNVKMKKEERRNSDTNLDNLISKNSIEHLFEKFMESRKENKNIISKNKISNLNNKNSKYSKNDISTFSTISNEKKDNKKNKINKRLLSNSYRKSEKLKMNINEKEKKDSTENNFKKLISKNINNQSVYFSKKNNKNNNLKTEKNLENNHGSTIQEPAHNIPKILAKRTPINFPFSSNYKNNINKNYHKNDLSINKPINGIKNILLPSKKSKSPESNKTKNSLLNNNQNFIFYKKNIHDLKKSGNLTTGKQKKDVKKILEQKKINQINEFNLDNTEEIKIENKPIKSLPNNKEKINNDDSQIEDSYNTKEIDEKSSSSSQKSKHKSEFIKKSSPLINKVLSFQTGKNEFNNLKYKKNNFNNKRINIENKIKTKDENSSLPKINFDKSYNENINKLKPMKSINNENPNNNINNLNNINNEIYVTPILNQCQNLKNQVSKNENKEKNNINDNIDTESDQYVDATEIYHDSESDRYSSTILDSDDSKESFYDIINNSTNNLNNAIRNSGSEQMIQKYNIFQSRKDFSTNLNLNNKNKFKNLNFIFGFPNNVIGIIFSFLNLDMLNCITLLNSNFHNIFKPIIYNIIFNKIKKINENENPRNKIKESLFKYSKLKYDEKKKDSLKDEYEKYIGNRICESENEIIKDLNRTFPEIPEFQNGKEKYNKLYHILYAYANYNEKINYAQGLNFLAGYSIYLFDKEEECFIFVDGLIQKFKLEDFLGVNNNLKFKIEIIDSHLKLNCQTVYNYLKEIHLSHEFFTINWVITLFANSMDKNELFFLWDCLIIFGWKFFYYFIVSILKKYENKILDTDVSQMSFLMKNLFRSQRFKNNFLDIMEKTVNLMQEEKTNRMFRAKSTINSKR